MRVLFSSLAAHGHTYPLIPLAAAARAAGHDVSFATGGVMHPALRVAGFEPIDAGMSILEAAPEAISELFGDAAADLTSEQLRSVGAAAFGSVLPRRFLRDLEPVLRALEPELVVFDGANSGAELAARQAGVPAVSHGFGPAVSAGFEEHRQRLAEFATDLGISAPVEESVPFLDIYPASLQGPETASSEHRVAMRPVPHSEPTPLPERVLRRDRDRKLVYLTFGTGFGTAAGLRQAIGALARPEVQVLVATGPSVEVEELGELPDNVMAEPWVPQAEVLRHADLFVHHGGSGTTLGALSAGVPQLLLPAGADQFANAEAVRD